ncbi:Guanylate kinase/L-type calcium channel [Niveomyces insectorum RCEF 264]|uniref:guanylate kinase n=1 Tax=Niveomyces insectorum RCEF 264 TaxID=1081102 RepID=A0A168A448_9HYPO|nr:Guanylate kinase/L-type calcium channel [Niveomyces insectorum RCEF 264]
MVLHDSHGSRDNRPVVISGPSGVGKSTLCRKLLETYPETFSTTVSHTTRQPRPGEVDGRDYYFVSRDEFASLAAANAFVEYTEYNGHRYGTSKQTMLDQTARGWTAVVVLDVDVDMDGVKALKKAPPPVHHETDEAAGSPPVRPRFVFIRPPSLAALEARLRSRDTDDEESVQRRLARARTEMEYAEAGGVYDKIITNEDVEAAFRELVHFVSDTQ